MRSRYLWRLVALGAFTLLLEGCESGSSSAPPITAPLVRAGIRQNAEARRLTEGRLVFLSRCIECHALPQIEKYTPDRLREIVATMSGRASLSADEHDAALKYLLTIRSYR